MSPPPSKAPVAIPVVFKKSLLEYVFWLSIGRPPHFWFSVPIGCPTPPYEKERKNINKYFQIC